MDGDEVSAELKKGQAIYQRWQGKIQDALKREKTFRKESKRVVKLYEGDKAEQTPFAILYSNTETLQPAVYNARPIPFVDRRFKDPDPVAKMAAEAGTRILKFLIEAESDEYDNFDELIPPTVLDALLTNRGVTRFKYVADTAGGQVSNESVFGEAVRWDKFFHGHARTWKKVPWIGFEWDMDREEVEANFPDKKDQISFDDLEDQVQEEQTGDNKEQLSGVKLAKVWEIWDKSSRKVYFFSPCFKDGALKIVDDPLKLAGFFPVPKPLNFMRKVTSLIPTPLYIQYEQQAKELNDITTRLKRIIRALKVRGFYNSTIEGIEKVLDADDNTLIPAENMASMPDGTTADKMLWIMPLNDLVQTAQSLYNQREQVKQVIYEITGISDILRGSSIASETATAQNIKNQWGTLRLKKMQKEVQRYCRDSLRIILEIAVTRFDTKTVAAMTGLPYPTAEMKQQAQLQAQAIQQQASMMTVQTPIEGQGQPPQQPQAPQIPPEIRQILQSPSWEDVLGLLRDDTLRAYRVDIETNSTIDAEASQDKQDISELLNALSQFLNGVAPLIEKGILPFDVAKNMMLAIARRFTFGPQLEDSLNQMSAPPPPPEAQPDPSEQVKLEAIKAKAQADTAKSQLDMQQAQQQAQLDAQELEGKKQLMALEFQIKQAELQIKQQELEIQREGLRMKGEANLQAHQIKMAGLAAKAAQPEKAPENATV